MTYEQRIKAIFDWLYRSDTAVLAGYEEPNHLSDAALIAEVNMLVEEINALIPKQVTVETMPTVLVEARTCLRRRHGARTWPTSKVLQAAMTDAVQNKAKLIAGEIKAEINLSQENLAAKRIRERQPVGENWLYGPKANRLLEKGLITLDDLELYRQGHRQNLIDLHGESGATTKIARLTKETTPTAPQLEAQTSFQPKSFDDAPRYIQTEKSW
jgi:hypothetical protein